MMNVELRAGVGDGHVVVALRGELDTADAEMTGVAVAELAEGGQQLIIDLEALDFIDCHALNALLTARKPAGIKLATPPGIVLRLLTLLGVPAAAESAGTGSAGEGRGHDWAGVPQALGD
ncbi:MAG TPA: STAS domain-containing protein [Trebonia sp.]|jgi:anti-anti-sigma factor|nr:STAS domain-containing protein [Trebonia sp.]